MIVITSKNYERGFAPLLILVVVSVAAISSITAGLYLNSRQDVGGDVEGINEILKDDRNYLDKEKVEDAKIKGNVVGVAQLPDGSYTSYEVIDANLTSLNGSRYEGETKLKFLSGDFALGSFEENYISPFYLNDGTKSDAVIIDRAIIPFYLSDGEGIPLKLIQGTIKEGKLIGKFLAQTYSTGYFIAGNVDELGNTSSITLATGASKMSEAQIIISVKALSLFKEISYASVSNVLGVNNTIIDSTIVQGFPQPLYDKRKNTWNFGTSGTGLSTSSTAGVISYIQSSIDRIVEREVESVLVQDTENGTLTFNGVSGIQDIVSESSVLTVTGTGEEKILTLDLSGYLTSVSDGFVTTTSIKDGDVKESDLSDSSVTSSKITDGTIVNADISNSASIADSKLGQITTANKVAGSAVELSSTGGLENDSGLSLLTTCNDGELLKWNSGSTTWECANDTGGGGGGSVDVQENDTNITTGASVIDFLGSDFTLSNSPSGEANVSIDYTNSKIVRSDQTQSISGAWTFGSGVTIGSDTITDPTGTGISLSGGALTATLGTSIDISDESNLSASDGITLTGDNLTNSDKGSSQNIFKTIAISGQSDVVTDANGDTLTLAAGSNVTLTTDASTDTITIASTDTNTTYSAGNDLDLTGTTFDIESTLDSVSTINLLGTGTINGIDAIDNTSESTIESAIDTLGNLTSASSLVTVGTLTSGATGTGFTINLGSSTLSGDVTGANISGVDISDDTNLSATGGITLTGDQLSATLGTSIANSEIDNDAIDLDKVSATLTLDEQTTISAGSALALRVGNNVTFQTTGTGSIIGTDLSCTDCIGSTEISGLTWGELSGTPTTLSGYGITDALGTSTSFGGDVGGTYDAITISGNSVALGTDTTGNYVASITNGSGISGGNGGGEGSALTLALGALTGTWDQTGAFDIQLNNSSSELKILESGSTPTLYGIFDVGDLSSSDATYTFSGTSGTVLTSANVASALSGWDQDSSNDLTTSTSFTGDVSGNYNSIALGSGTVDDAELADTLSYTGALTLSNLTLSDTSIPLTGSSLTLDFNNASDRTLSILNSAAGVANLSIDGTITASNFSGSNTGDQTITLTGDVTGSGTGSFAATIAADSVALTTDTTGNYVSNVSSGNNAISVGGSAGEGWTPSVSLALQSSSNGLSSTTSSGSGLEITTGGITLLQGCSNAEILKWNETSDIWECSSDNSGGGGANSFETVALGSGTNPVADSSTDTLTFSDGSGITLSGDSSTDTITVSATLGTSIANSEIDNDTINFDKIASSLTLDEEITITAESALNLLVGNNVTLGVTGSGVINASDLVCTNCIGSTEISGLTWSEVSGTPTTLSGYGITDALSNSSSSTQTGYFGDVNLYDDTTPSHYLTITNAQNLTSTRTLSISTSDADRTLTISGDSTISGTNTGDQTITLTGDVTGSGTGSFAATIAADSVALTTDTTGNYVASITNGSGISGGNGGGEGSAITLALGALSSDWTQSGAFDVVLSNASSELKIKESTGDTYFGTLEVGDLAAADATYTFSGTSGTVLTSANISSALSSWDQDSSDDLTTATSFSGDVSGNYNSIAFGSNTVDDPELVDTLTYTGAFSVGNLTLSDTSVPLTGSSFAFDFNTANDRTLTITNSSGANVANLSVEGDVAGASVTTGGDTIDEFVGTGLTISSGDLQTTLGTSIANSELDNDTVDFDKMADSLTLDVQTDIVAGSALSLRVGNNATLTTTGSGVIIGTDLSCTDCIGSTEITDLTLGTDTSGNYVATVTGGAGLTGSGSTEGSTPTLAVGSGTGITVNADDIAVNQATNFAWTGVQTHTNTITDAGAQSTYALTLGDDGNADIVSGIQIDVTSTATGDTDTVYGLNISNITAQANVTETAINIGTGWEQAINVGGTLLSLSELQLIDSGIALSELTDSGTLTASTVDINGGAIDGTTIGGSSAAAGSFTTLTATSTLDARGDVSDSTGNLTLNDVVDISGITTISSNLNADGGLDVDDAFVVANGGSVSTISISDANIPLTGGDTTLDLNAAATRTLTITNSDGSNVAGLSVEGTIAASNFSGTSSGTNTGDQTITLTGDVTGSGTGSFAATIAGDSVALTTDTTGNYVASITNGTGISGANGGSEGAALTLSIDQSTAFTWTGLQTHTNTITNTGAQSTYALTLGNDTDTDTASAVQIDVTSVATGDADTIYGLNISNITAQSIVTETAINIGTGWEQAINAGGTLLSLTELQLLDGGIALSELTDSGTLTAGTVDINGGAIDGATIGGSSAGAGTFTQITITTGALAVNSESITFDGAALTINGGGAVDIQDGLTTDTLTVDSGNITASAGSVDANQTLGSTTSDNTLQITLTNGTSSGTQNVAYLDNAASSGTTESILVIDNSDTDTVVTNAIEFVIGGGSGFTNLFNVNGTAITSSEFTIVDGGIALSELTDSGTLTAGTVDINGGNIDGTAIGSASRSTALFTTLGTNGNVTLGDANSDTLTINSGSSGTGIAFGDSSFANCTALETVSGVLTCGTDDGGGSSLDSAYDSGGSLTVDAYDVLFDLNDSSNDYGVVIDNNTAGAIAIGLEFISGGGGSLTTAIDASASEIGTAIAIGSNDVTVGGSTITSSEFALIDSGISLSELTDSGTLTAGTVDINGGNIDGTVLGANSAAAGTFTTIVGSTVTSSGAIAANGESITFDGATLVINGGGAVDIQDGLTTDTLTVDSGNLSVSAGSIDGAQSLSSTTSDNTLQITLTNGTSSGTQNVAYLDNAASSGTTESILVIDNSDTDTVVTNAIEFVIGGGSGFTNLFNVNGTAITSSEFTIIDGGIALSELTDSGTLTAGTVDINGGAIDGVTIGGNSAGAGTFSSLTSNADLIVTGGDITGSNSESIDIGETDNGSIILSAAGETNNESLEFDFETAANTVTLASSTGVTNIDLSAIYLVNVGNSGTDFDSSGGLTLASTLTLSNNTITCTSCIDVTDIGANAVDDSELVDSLTYTGTLNISTNALVVNSDSITADGATLTINAGGTVNIQDNLTVDSDLTVTGGDFIGANADRIDIGESDNGSITFAAAGETNNEDFEFDLETAANTLSLFSSTGVTTIDLGSSIYFTNIGNSGTDFTSTGGLTLDDILTVNDDLTVALASASENVEITDASTPTSDILSIVADGAPTANDVNAVEIDFTTGDGSSVTNSALQLDVVSGGTASGDVVYGINITMDAADSSTQTAINVDADWDTVLGGTTAGVSIFDFTNFDVTSAGAIDIGSTITAGSGNEVITLSTGKVDADALTLTSSGSAGSVNSSSGLEVVSDGLTLLKGCSDGDVMQWDEGNSYWECDPDNTSAGGGIATIQVGDSDAVTSATTIDLLAADFDVTDSPTGEGNISIDYTNSGITRKAQADIVTGGWTFNTAATTFTTAINVNGGIALSTSNIDGTNFDVTGSSGNVDIGGTITTGSGNEVITLSTGKIDADAITLASAADGGSGTSSGSGLEARSDGIGLLQGCGDGQILKWVETTDTWDCADDSTGGGGAPDTAIFLDTAPAAWADNNTTELFNDATKPNITTDSTNATVLVSVHIRGTASNTANDAYLAARIVYTTNQTNPTCSGSTQLGEPMIGGFTTATTHPWQVSGTFLHNPSVANEVRYTVCTSSESTGTATDTAEDVRISLVELGADLAENYYTSDDSIGPGDVVMIDSSLPAGVKKAINPYNPQTLGVVSTAPGITLDDAVGLGIGRPVPVALAGRIPVKVSTENGRVLAGDLLTSSSIPGVAMKATKSGQIIGQAIQDFNYPDGEIGLVTTFVKTDYWNGARVSDLISNIVSLENGEQVVSSKDILSYFVSQDVLGIEESDFSEIVTDRIVSGIEIITPRVTANTIETNGLTVDGVITADIIRANKIEGLEIYTDKISSLSELYEKLSQNIDGIENGLSETENIDGEEIDLRVLGELETQKGLVVAGESEFKGNSVFKSFVEFVNTVFFRGEVNFANKVFFDKDSAGFAVIPTGAVEVEVNFAKEYSVEPIITASPNVATVYSIIDTTSKGFKIKLTSPASNDIRFSWHAVAVKDPFVTKGNTPSSVTLPPVLDSSPTPVNTLIPEDESIIQNDQSTPIPLETIIPTEEPKNEDSEGLVEDNLSL